jgi:short-subunit dehydrogenase
MRINNSLNYYKDKVVWITGASSGIGLSLLKILCKSGAKLIITSSNPEKLEKASDYCKKYNVECHPLLCDLSDCDEVANLIPLAISVYNKIDILILNAGKSTRGRAVETNIYVDREIMELDYFSNIIIAKEIAKNMLKNGGGNIAVTSSITGKFGFPLRSSYAAAKHALHGFFETLGLEEEKNGLKVTIVCPGRINTDISFSALLADGSKYNKQDHGQKNGMPADVCAMKYLKAIQKGKKEIFIGNKEILMVYFKRYIPSLFYKLAQKVKPT